VECTCACRGWPVCLISVGIWAGKRADRRAYSEDAHKILCSAIRRNIGNCDPVGVPRRTSRPWSPQPEPAGRAGDPVRLLGGYVGGDVVPMTQRRVRQARIAVRVPRPAQRFRPFGRRYLGQEAGLRAPTPDRPSRCRRAAGANSDLTVAPTDHKPMPANSRRNDSGTSAGLHRRPRPVPMPCR
jgi:hypothetical protein